MCTAEFLVCALSVLVTLLIGYNVWSAINVNGRNREIRSDLDRRMIDMHDDFDGLIQRIDDRLDEQAERNNNQIETQRKAFANFE